VSSGFGSSFPNGGDSGRIVDVLVQGANHVRRLKRRDERGDRTRSAERVELHIEPAIERRRLALRRPPVLEDICCLELLLLRPVVDACVHDRSWSQAAASFAW